MARATIDPDADPVLPTIGVRLDSLGALVVVPGAILTPADAVEYARAIFAAASACRQSRLDVAGHA